MSIKICPVCGYEWGDSAKYCGSPQCVKTWNDNGMQGNTPELEYSTK